MTRFWSRLRPNKTYSRYEILSPHAEILALKVDIDRVTDADDKARMENLRTEAEKNGSLAKEIASFLRKDLYWTAGPGQIYFPVLGTAIVLLFLPLVFIPTTFDSAMGLRIELFMWIMIAGTAGGVVKVLRASLQRTHRARQPVGLVLTGVIHPFLGAIFAVVVVAALNSGFITMPVSDPTESSRLGDWTKGEVFLVFSAFIAGFAEDVVTGLMSRMPSQSSG